MGKAPLAPPPRSSSSFIQEKNRSLLNQSVNVSSFGGEALGGGSFIDIERTSLNGSNVFLRNNLQAKTNSNTGVALFYHPTEDRREYLQRVCSEISAFYERIVASLTALAVTHSQETELTYLLLPLNNPVQANASVLQGISHQDEYELYAVPRRGRRRVKERPEQLPRALPSAERRAVGRTEGHSVQNRLCEQQNLPALQAEGPLAHLRRAH